MRFDEVTQDDRLLAVETPVAEDVVFVSAGEPAHIARLPLDIFSGRETVLGDPGPHLRLLRLTQPLEVARSYPLRLVFEKGGTVKTVLTVDYARFL
jgi:periplasmic copper chaperone A